MIVSVTERQTYKRCRLQWKWASFNGEAYQVILPKPALGIGRLWHAVQAEWSLHPEADPNELCLTLANQALDDARAAYFERIHAPISEPEEAKLYDQFNLVISMTKNYADHWGSPLPEGFRMVSPEQTCVIPIPGTLHTTVVGAGECPFHPNCDGQHYLEGTLDGLIADDFGRVWVLERKTYGQRPKIEVLNMQDQFLAYLWIVAKLGFGDIGGIAYDGIWKRKQPPKGSTLEDLFLRIRLNRSPREFVRFEQDLAAEVNEMANAPAIYTNRRWDGCWDCDFVEPCIRYMRGEDANFLLENQYTRRPRTEDNSRSLKYADD